MKANRNEWKERRTSNQKLIRLPKEYMAFLVRFTIYWSHTNFDWFWTNYFISQKSHTRIWKKKYHFRRYTLSNVINEIRTIRWSQFSLFLEIKMKKKSEMKTKQKWHEKIYSNIYRKLIYRFPYAKFIIIFTVYQIAHYLQNVFDE